jgi:hypothetical protein
MAIQSKQLLRQLAARNKVRLPFVGARYERNWPTFDRLPVRVTVLNNSTTYFGCPGVSVSMPWNFPKPAPAWRTTDEVKFNLEQFLEWFHPIENVINFRGQK